MRPIWFGVVSVGLVDIPIETNSGTAGTSMDFTMLHKTDFSLIRYAKLCRKDRKEFTQYDIVKVMNTKEASMLP